MGLNDRNVETKKLHFGEEWIEVRTERMYGDTVDAQKAAARNRSAEDVASGDATGRIEFDISEFNLALVSSMTIAWSDDAPITAENYRLLPDAIVQEVLNEIIGQVNDEEEEENLENGSSSPLEQEGGSSL